MSKIKTAIIVLSILLAVSLVALVGTLVWTKYHGSSSDSVPGNSINADSFVEYSVNNI